jgi:hypothetical protein
VLRRAALLKPSTVVFLAVCVSALQPYDVPGQQRIRMGHAGAVW